VGIIGRNGSGKSTLLKILSRITAPTEGRVEIRGRVGSLLEVGTGFHPELTGRENIYLNGAVIGMKRAEVARKFDEIVAFAEIEKFLDTPVKRYSSGMYVRLAFSVAAHLEPEVLLVDEVLAVGDAEFQKKCLGKMGEVTGEGRTVLFVSHNMAAIGTLCNLAVLLDQGKVISIGRPKDVITQYLSGKMISRLNVDLSDKQIGDNVARLLRVRFINEDHTNADALTVDEKFGVEITYEIKTTGESYKPGANFLIMTNTGGEVFQSLETQTDKTQRRGIYRSIAWIPPNMLNDQSYVLTVALTTYNPVHIHCQADIEFEVRDNLNAITRGDYRGQMHGVVRPYLVWETQRIGD
jgi:lipopolysaccharide transport system ATP-binding protein